MYEGRQVHMIHYSQPVWRELILKEGLRVFTPQWNDQPAGVYLVEAQDADLAWGRDQWTVDAQGIELTQDDEWPGGWRSATDIEPRRLTLVHPVKRQDAEWDGPQSLELALAIRAAQAGALG